MAMKIFLAALSMVVCSEGVRTAPGRTPTPNNWTHHNASQCAPTTGETYHTTGNVDLCKELCENAEGCRGFSKGSTTGDCFFALSEEWNPSAIGDFICYELKASRWTPKASLKGPKEERDAQPVAEQAAQAQPATAATASTTASAETPGEYGDPHAKNTHGQRFDIKRPGNHTLIVVPRGASIRQAQLHVEARVTPRGDVCNDGALYTTGIRLGGGWLQQLGGDVELYAATDKFNSPDVVGLRLGVSGNISLDEFASLIPEGHLKVRRSHPDQPTKPHTHVNTLTMLFRVGPSLVKVGWSHERLQDGAVNWLWFAAESLGNAAGGIGGLLGLDDISEAAKMPEECGRAARDRNAAARKLLGSWASATH